MSRATQIILTSRQMYILRVLWQYESLDKPYYVRGALREDTMPYPIESAYTVMHRLVNEGYIDGYRPTEGIPANATSYMLTEDGREMLRQWDMVPENVIDD